MEIEDRSGQTFVRGGDIFRFQGDLYIVPNGQMQDLEDCYRGTLIGISLSTGEPVLCSGVERPPSDGVPGIACDVELVNAKVVVE